MLCLFSLLITFFVSFVAAQNFGGPTLVYGLQAQRPPIARVNQTWTWTLLNGTFQTAANDTLVLSATGLPSWASFNASTATFSGTPGVGDLGESDVWVRATSQTISGAPMSSDSFELLVSDAPEPVIKWPLPQQLFNGTSLPDGCILLYDDSLRIPPYWSFSIGLQWNTFALPNDAFAYYTAYLKGTTSLPSWLQFDPATVTFNGVAPASGVYTIIIFGSSVYGYGDVSQTFTITVSEHAFDLITPLPPIQTSLGAEVDYVVPTVNLTIDHVPATPSNITAISVDLSHLPFLTFSNENRTITGTVPASAANVMTTQITVVFNNTYGESLTTSLNLTVVGATNATGLLSQTPIPALLLTPGQSFTSDLSQYTLSSTAQYTISASPAAASQWLSFNGTGRVLSGTAPNPAPSYGNVSVSLIGRDPTSGATQSSDFVIAFVNGTGNVNGGGSGNGSGNGNGGDLQNLSATHGLSRAAKLAIGLSIGLVAACLLLLLCCCCWKRRRGQSTSEFYHEEQHSTLKGDMSPYPAMHSPLPDPIMSPLYPIPEPNKPKIFAGMFRKLSQQKTEQVMQEQPFDEPRRFGLLSVVAPHPTVPAGLGIESPDNSFDVQMAGQHTTYRAPSRESVADSFMSGQESTSTNSMLYTPERPDSVPRRWVPSASIPVGARHQYSREVIDRDLPDEPPEEDETVVQPPSPTHRTAALAMATRQKVDYGDARLREVVGRRDVERQITERANLVQSRHLDQETVDAALAAGNANRYSVLSEPYVPREGEPVTSAVVYSPEHSLNGHSPPMHPNEWGNVRIVSSSTPPRDVKNIFAARAGSPERGHQRGRSDELGSLSASIKHEPQVVAVKTGGVLKFVPVLTPKPIAILGSPTRNAPSRTTYKAYVVDEDDERRPLPKWLSWNDATLEFWGIPKEADIGELHIQIISRKPAEPGSPQRRDTFDSSSTGRSDPEIERLVARVHVQVTKRVSRLPAKPTIVRY